MYGKLFLLTLVYVSLVQVRGTPEKDEKIKKAIEEVGEIMKTTYWNTNDFSLYSGFILVESNAKIEKYLKEAREESHDVRDFLRETALFMKEEAKASNKPPSVFSCIDEVREKFNEKVEKLTTQYSTDIKIAALQLVEKGRKINSDSLKLFQAVGYERGTFVDRISSSKQIKDVEAAVNYYDKLWRLPIYTSLEKMRDNLSLVVNIYDMRVKDSSRIYNTEMILVRIELPDEMQKCLYIKKATSGKSAFMNLINMQ